MFKFEGTAWQPRYSDGSGKKWEIPITVYAENADEAHAKISGLWASKKVESSISSVSEVLEPEVIERIVEVEVPGRRKGFSRRPL